MSPFEVAQAKQSAGVGVGVGIVIVVMIECIELNKQSNC
jgi:hypothetical protein